MNATSRQAHVADVMTPAPVTLTEQQSVHHAGIVLLREGISAAPVVDDHGTVVGVFSHSDVLARFDRVLIPEMNLGQLVQLLRRRYLIPAESFPKIQGQPFRIDELEERIRQTMES